MSALSDTAARAAGWIHRHALLLVGLSATLALVAAIFVPLFRLYDQRQARLQVLQDVTVSGCESGNVIRSALRDYVAQTITTRPPPPGADAATVHEIETRNAAAKEALDRAELVFADRDCAALARALKNPTERTTP